MNLENYHKFRKVIKLIEVDKASIITIKDISELENFIYSLVKKFMKKLDFDLIYRKNNRDIPYPTISIKYILLDLYKNKVIVKKNDFCIDINYDDDYGYLDVKWNIDLNFPFLTGDIILGFKMVCEVSSYEDDEYSNFEYKNKCAFVFKEELVVKKTNINLGYLK